MSTDPHTNAVCRVHYDQRVRYVQSPIFNRAPPSTHQPQCVIHYIEENGYVVIVGHMSRMFSRRHRTVARSGTLASTALMAAVACTNVIVPPRDPLQPRLVFVLDHGRHASLVLPAADSLLVRFAYGDWTYYAKAETGAGEASAAVLLPTTAGLGRRTLAEPATEEGVRSALRVGVEGIYEVVVDSAKAGRLLEVLDSIFDADRESVIYNRGYDLEFVRHPRRYTIFRNSNWMVADWLRQLGCRVTGLLLFSKWKLEPRSPPAAAGERDPAPASRGRVRGARPRTRS